MSDDRVGRDDAGLGMGTLVVSCLFALVVGAIAGLVTTFVHAQLAPWGIVAGLVIALAIVLGFRLVFGSRIVGALAALGFLIGEALLALPASGPTVLVLHGPIGWVWTIGSTVLVVAALVQPWPDGWPGRRARRP